MYGFEAITMHNGWAMAIAGALIVFSGLVILSAVISQLHKVLDFFEDRINWYKSRRAKVAKAAPSNPVKPESGREARFLGDPDQVVEQYKAASRALGNTFALSELYRIAKEMDAPHPHLTISYLRQQDYLIPLGDGIFSWRQ